MGTDGRQDPSAQGSGKARQGPLAGLRVLDLTRFLAGPFGSMILADMGADVVVVESPDGDSTRYLAPHFFQGDSAYFLSINRNKRSIAVDLKTAEGQRVLHRLVRWSDVVLDNLRPAQREALGVSYAQLERINPRVVSCSLTGFGSDGPYRDRPAYDIIVQALSGVMSLTGEPGGPSLRTGVPIGDLVAGMYMTIGVLAAVREREDSGRGQHIDVGMLDCQVSFLSYLASYYLISDVVPRHQGRAHDSIPTYNTFLASDGVEIVVAANTEAMWRSMCDVLGVGELVKDPRFRTNTERLENRRALLDELERAFLRSPADHWYSAFTSAGVPAAPINTLDRVVADPQVVHRGMIIDVPHREGGSFRSVGSPLKPSRSEPSPPSSPAALGEHGPEILADLGLSPSEIDRLIDSRVLVVNEPGVDYV